MVWEDWEGNERRVSFGELQELSNRFANVLEALGVERERPRRHAAAVAARDGGRLPRHLQARRDPALDVGAVRRRGHRAPAARLGRAARGHRRGQPRPHPGGPGRSGCSCMGDDFEPAMDDASPEYETGRHARPTTRRSSTTRPARPGSPRASCTRTATCSRTRSSSSATTCATASSSTARASGRGPPGICPLLGPVALRRGGARAGAQGRLRPGGAPALPVEARRGEHVHHAHRAARDDRRGGRGQALPARASCASRARPASRSTPR